MHLVGCEGKLCMVNSLYQIKDAKLITRQSLDVCMGELKVWRCGHRDAYIRIMDSCIKPNTINGEGRVATEHTPFIVGG